MEVPENGISFYAYLNPAQNQKKGSPTYLGATADETLRIAIWEGRTKGGMPKFSIKITNNMSKHNRPGRPRKNPVEEVPYVPKSKVAMEPEIEENEPETPEMPEPLGFDAPRENEEAQEESPW